MIRPAYQYAAKFLSLRDGDTYKMDVDCGFNIHAHVHIRLKDWNCPERAKPGGREASLFAKLRLLASSVIILKTEKDDPTFDRWVADVFVDGKDLGVLLGEAGHAVRVNKDLGVISSGSAIARLRPKEPVDEST